MIIGFTGTRHGMTEGQRQQLERLFADVNAIELHHGDCVGADEEAHEIATDARMRVVLHPPTNPKLRAFCEAETSFTPRPYLERNRQIVENSEMLVAAPSGPEVIRSGTWATVRYAKNRGRRVAILDWNGVATDDDNPDPVT